MEADRYGKYTVVATVHAGAFTNVYKVKDEADDLFALKVLYTEKLAAYEPELREEIIRRFRQAPEINSTFPDDRRFLKHFGPVQE